MRLNETALIPQRAMGIRVGQRGKVKTIPYPTCDKCDEDALVSVSHPPQATHHRCVGHLIDERPPTQREIVATLVQLGIL